MGTQRAWGEIRIYSAGDGQKERFGRSEMWKERDKHLIEDAEIAP